MSPEGPYKHSMGMSSDRFIVSELRNNREVILIVVNGQQRNEGIVVESLADARWHLKREGFERASMKKS